MKNKYVYCSRISEKKFREILRLFSLDLEANQTAKIVGLSRNTINKYYKTFRERIVMICNQDSPLSGEIEVNKSYFGARHVKGKRGRGAYGKTIVFGLLKREGKVYTEIIPDVKAVTLQGVIRGRVDINSVIHSDGWRGYDGRLVDIGYNKHFRVHHGKNEFVRGKSHINGIESFWSYAKIRLVKFRGIDKKSFNLHLKECEFRFNHRGEDLYKILLEIFRKEPLRLS
jgi:transposase-like protein